MTACRPWSGNPAAMEQRQSPRVTDPGAALGPQQERKYESHEQQPCWLGIGERWTA